MYDIRYIGDASALAAYLHDKPRPRWARRFVVHHTVRPTPTQWRGLVTMRGLRRYYRSLGWDSGPQLFFAPDGIWQLSPVDRPAISSNRCNNYAIAGEVVGYYDDVPWQEPIKSLVIGGIATILQWSGMPPEAIIGHRDCGSPKTCPGRAIDLDDVRRWVAAWQPEAGHPSQYDCYQVMSPAGANVREGPATSFPVALGGRAVLGYGEQVAVDAIVYGANVQGEKRWAHLADGRGFVSMILLRPAAA